MRLSIGRVVLAGGRSAAPPEKSGPGANPQTGSHFSVGPAAAPCARRNAASAGLAGGFLGRLADGFGPQARGLLFARRLACGNAGFARAANRQAGDLPLGDGRSSRQPQPARRESV
jgi:hypothetical protein